MFMTKSNRELEAREASMSAAVIHAVAEAE
jgi:hypothetical protein